MQAIYYQIKQEQNNKEVTTMNMNDYMARNAHRLEITIVQTRQILDKETEKPYDQVMWCASADGKFSFCAVTCVDMTSSEGCILFFIKNANLLTFN